MSIYEKEFPELFYFIREDKVRIGYDANIRRFYIPLRHLTGVQLMYYCPWSGKKLPSCLSDKYFEILDAAENEEARERLLVTMQDETWWINLGL